jgi:hypothetical protein
MAHDNRYFSQTGYRIDNDDIYHFFQSYGQVQNHRISQSIDVRQDLIDHNEMMRLDTTLQRQAQRAEASHAGSKRWAATSTRRSSSRCEHNHTMSVGQSDHHAYSDIEVQECYNVAP